MKKLCDLQDGSAELATSYDEDEVGHTAADSLPAPSVSGQQEIKDSSEVRPVTHRKRNRSPELVDDPDQATSVRVRHSDHQHAAAPAAAQSPTPRMASAAEAAADKPGTAIAAAATSTVPTASAPQRGAAKADSAGPVQVSAPHGRLSITTRPSASQVTAASAPAESASSQQGDCIGPNGNFVGRAAAAGLPPNIMRQTRAALGLWEQLHETASTPSTVLAPVNRHAMAARTVSVGTDNSAA